MRIHSYHKLQERKLIGFKGLDFSLHDPHSLISCLNFRKFSLFEHAIIIVMIIVIILIIIIVIIIFYRYWQRLGKVHLLM